MLRPLTWRVRVGEIKPLFDGLAREKFNLGQATLDFCNEREPGLLSDDDREYLKLLIGRRTTEPPKTILTSMRHTAPS